MRAGSLSSATRSGRGLLPILAVLACSFAVCGLATDSSADLGTMWRPIFELPPPPTPGGNGLALPDVSYAEDVENGEYLVVWQMTAQYETDPARRTKWELWGRILNRDGTSVSRPIPFAIFQDPLEDPVGRPVYSAHDPRVAASGVDGAWIVTYVVDTLVPAQDGEGNHYYTQEGHYAAQACVVSERFGQAYVKPDIAWVVDPVDISSRSISFWPPVPPPLVPLGVDIYPIGHVDIGATTVNSVGRYLAVWDAEIPWSGYSDIRGRLLQVLTVAPDKLLSVLGREIVVDTGYDSKNPAMNQQGDQFVIAWEDHWLLPYYGWVQIIASLVGPSGIVSPYQVVVHEDLYGDPEYPQVLPNSQPSVASNGQRYAVVWQHVLNPGRLPTEDPWYEVGYGIIGLDALGAPGLVTSGFLPRQPDDDSSRAEPCVASATDPTNPGGPFIVCYSNTPPYQRPVVDPWFYSDVYWCLLDARGRVRAETDPTVADGSEMPLRYLKYGHPEATLGPQPDLPFYGEVAVVWDTWVYDGVHDDPPNEDRPKNPPYPLQHLYGWSWDWLPGDTTAGLYDPVTGRFFLRESNDAGAANSTFRYGPTASTYTPLSGDWNGDMTDTVGLYDPTGGRFYLRNSNTPGVADLTIRRGPAPSTWIPIVGDWDGDGTDTPGFYDPTLSKFHLWNLKPGEPLDGFAVFQFGPAPSTWKPIVGDWDGDGVDTVGLYNPTSGRFYLRNSNTAGPAEVPDGGGFHYGPAPSTWLPVAGDWDGVKGDSIGLYSQTTGSYYLRNSNAPGPADLTFRYGPAPNTWVPVVGNWDGTSLP